MLSLVVLGVPGLALAQSIELGPNQISGTMALTNTDPAILDILRGEIGSDVCLVSATSTAPTGFTASTPHFLNDPEALACDFELSAEASGGVGEVTYRVGGTMWTNRHGPSKSGNGQFHFPKVEGVVLQPDAQQPGGATVDLSTCAGVTQVRFRYDCEAEDLDAPENEFPIQSGQFYTSFGFTYFLPNKPLYHYFAPDGVGPFSTTLRYTTGTSPLWDTISHAQTVELDPTCDTIQPICIEPPNGTTDLGRIVGAFDIVGHEESLGRGLIGEGPDANRRDTAELVPAPYNAPLEDPTTWWTLPNLIGGSWRLNWGTWIGTDYDFQQITGATHNFDVAVGETTDVSDALVMEPATIEGHVHLENPGVAGDPNNSSLASLWRVADLDSNGDGIPNRVNVTDGSHLQHVGAPVSNSYSMFDGWYDAVTGQFDGDYEAVLPNPWNRVENWRAGRLTLKFVPGQNNLVPDTVRDGIAPTNFRFGDLNISRPLVVNPWLPLGPGDVATIDYDLCFSEIALGYSVSGDERIFNPNAKISGGLNGEGTFGPQNYTASGTAWGSPYGYGATQVRGTQIASDSGLVMFTLPEGDYTITPNASVIAASGLYSTANYQGISLEVGCGQSISIVPGLSVSASAECADEDGMRVVGSVSSNGVPVDRVWVDVDGVEVDLCTNCGADPALDTIVDAEVFDGCDHRVTVNASSSYVGGIASVSEAFAFNNPYDGLLCEPDICGGPEANTAPEAVATPDGGVFECTSPEGTAVALDGTGSTDADDDLLAYGWSPIDGLDDLSAAQPMVTLPPGDYTYTLTVDDGIAEDSDDASFSIVDTTPPQVTLEGADVEFRGCAQLGTPWQDAGVTATDTCEGDLDIAVEGEVNVHAPGTYLVTYSATDSSGQTHSATRTVVQGGYDIIGFEAPLTDVVPAYFPIADIPRPTRRVKAKGNAPLKIRQDCDGTSITDAIAPFIVSVDRLGNDGEELITVEIEDTGAANDNGPSFRASGDKWVYNLNIQGKPPGLYIVTFQTSDGAQWRGSIYLE